MLKHIQKAKNDWHIILFCVKQVRQLSGEILPIYFMMTIIESFVPFLNLYLSASLLDELLLSKRGNILISIAILLVMINFAVNIFRHWLAQMQQNHKAGLSQKVDNTIAEIFSNINYETIEHPLTRELYTRYRNYDMWYGGLSVFLDNLFGVLTETGSIIMSIVLLLRLLTLKSVGYEGGLMGFIDSSGATMVVLLILVLNIVVTFRENIYSSDLALTYEKGMSDANKKFFYFAFELPNDYHFGKDIRLYNMAELINTELQNFFSASHRFRAKFTEDLVRSETKNISVATFTYGFIFMYIVLKTILGVISTGSIVLFTGAAANFSSGLNRLSANFAQLHLCAQMLVPFQEILNLPIDHSSTKESAKKIPTTSYDIEFRDVSFRYPGMKHDVLRNLSFEINPEAHLALVGPNGSGKTTLIKLLCRLYEPSTGSILLNGIDIREYDLDDYMQRISVVFQDFQLFSFSVGQNVSAQQGYDTERTWSCLRQVGMEDRVRKMPDELDTHLYSFTDDNGVELSGGEAQKIAIARALYKDAPLIILDEPTASLDPISESEIYNHMNHMIQQKTAIFISHRLSSCKYCDEIIVLNQGQIIQQGRHEVLLNDKSGLYYEMWNAQAKQFEDTRLEAIDTRLD